LLISAKLAEPWHIGVMAEPRLRWSLLNVKEVEGSLHWGQLTILMAKMGDLQPGHKAVWASRAQVWPLEQVRLEHRTGAACSWYTNGEGVDSGLI